jgi:hypothetical protein
VGVRPAIGDGGTRWRCCGPAHFSAGQAAGAGVESRFVSTALAMLGVSASGVSFRYLA